MKYNLPFGVAGLVASYLSFNDISEAYLATFFTNEEDVITVYNEVKKAYIADIKKTDFTNMPYRTFVRSFSGRLKHIRDEDDDDIVRIRQTIRGRYLGSLAINSSFNYYLNPNVTVRQRFQLIINHCRNFKMVYREPFLTLPNGHNLIPEHIDIVRLSLMIYTSYPNLDVYDQSFTFPVDNRCTFNINMILKYNDYAFIHEAWLRIIYQKEVSKNPALIGHMLSKPFRRSKLHVSFNSPDSFFDGEGLSMLNKQFYPKIRTKKRSYKNTTSVVEYARKCSPIDFRMMKKALLGKHYVK